MKKMMKILRNKIFNLIKYNISFLNILNEILFTIIQYSLVDIYYEKITAFNAVIFMLDLRFEII